MFDTPSRAKTALSHLQDRLAEVQIFSANAEVDCWPYIDDGELSWLKENNDVIWLDQLTSYQPRTGVGRAAMAELCLLADQHHCRIALNPWAQDHPGALRQSDLEAFYISLGFSWRRDHVMIREPGAPTVMHVRRDLPFQPVPNRSEYMLCDSLPPSEQTATAFTFAVFDDGSILFSRSLKPGRDVEPAGGHIEPGEDQKAAAQREAQEEIGAIVGDLIPIGQQIMLSQGKKPEGWKYAFPLSFQAFFAARIISVTDYVPNDECAEPVRISDFSVLKPHMRHMAYRARFAVLGW